MPECTDLGFETRLQHLGEEVKELGSVTPPIHMTSLFVFDSVDDYAHVYSGEPANQYYYTRLDNPTLQIVEDKIASLEGVESAKLFASGMAAISAAILHECSQGDHIVMVDTCYGPSVRFVKEYLPRFGIEHTLVDGRDTQGLVDAIQPNTKLIYLESPSSILFRLQDLESIAGVARERGTTTVLDNTNATPAFQRPAEFGIDVIVHTATKYFGGHSDVVAGIVCSSKERMRAIRVAELELLGGCASPMNGWLIMRGLRTLSLRMQRAEQTATGIATFLQEHEAVEQVFYSGLADHPQRALVEKQQSGSSGLLSFLPKTQDEGKLKEFFKRLQLFQLGVSWGGFESLCVPIRQQPLDWPEEKIVVRIYCGLETPQDLRADLENALAALA